MNPPHQPGVYCLLCEALYPDPIPGISMFRACVCGGSCAEWESDGMVSLADGVLLFGGANCEAVDLYLGRSLFGDVA